MKSLKTYPLVLVLFERVRPFVSMHTTIKIYKGLIEPHFDYCSAVWYGLTQQLSEKLQKLQNRVIGVITKSSYKEILNSLGWDKLSATRAKQFNVQVH